MQQHGKYRIISENNVMIIDLDYAFDTAFNLEGIKALFAQMHKAIQTFSAKPWAMLVIFSQDSLATVDAEPEIRHFVSLFEDKGLSHTAYINANLVLREQIVKVRQGNRGQFAFFTDTRSAIDWLKSNGFIVTCVQ